MAVNNQNTVLSYSKISIPLGYDLDQDKIRHDVDVNWVRDQQHADHLVGSTSEFYPVV